MSRKQLGICFECARPLSPEAIADALIETSSTVAGVMDSHEKQGLVRRTGDPSDRRMLQIEITDAGRMLMQELGQPLGHSEMKWMSWLTAEEHEQLIEYLGRCNSVSRTGLPLSKLRSLTVAGGRLLIRLSHGQAVVRRSTQRGTSCLPVQQVNGRQRSKCCRCLQAQHTERRLGIAR